MKAICASIYKQKREQRKAIEKLLKSELCEEISNRHQTFPPAS